MHYDEKKERIIVNDETMLKDNTEWVITLGAWRTNEFFNLLEKIHAKEFDRLTLGEIWLVSDLLDAIHERGLV